jgi:hypothetical protein
VTPKNYKRDSCKNTPRKPNKTKKEKKKRKTMKKEEPSPSNNPSS